MKVHKLFIFLILTLCIYGTGEEGEKLYAKGVIDLEGRSVEEAKIVAKSLAMAELSKEIEVYVESIEELERSLEKNKYQSEIKIKSQNIFRNMKVIDEGLDENGKYYVILEVEVEEFKNQGDF